MPSGGLPSTFFDPTSFQSVDSTVPFDSNYKKKAVQTKGENDNDLFK